METAIATRKEVVQHYETGETDIASAKPETALKEEKV